MKGILKTFEVLLGLSFVLVAFLAIFAPQNVIPDLETVSWKATGMESLRSLDASNDLRFDALNNDTASIESKLSKSLPANVNVTVQVCDAGCNAPSIESEKVTSVSYLISGDAGNPSNKEIVAYMWSNE